MTGQQVVYLVSVVLSFGWHWGVQRKIYNTWPPHISYKIYTNDLPWNHKVVSVSITTRLHAHEGAHHANIHHIQPLAILYNIAGMLRLEAPQGTCVYKTYIYILDHIRTWRKCHLPLGQSHQKTWAAFWVWSSASRGWISSVFKSGRTCSWFYLQIRGHDMS